MVLLSCPAERPAHSWVKTVGAGACSQLFALVFGRLQIWWIGSTLRGRRLARPMTEQEFRRSLVRIWSGQRKRR